MYLTQQGYGQFICEQNVYTTLEDLHRYLERNFTKAICMLIVALQCFVPVPAGRHECIPFVQCATVRLEDNYVFFC